MKLQLMVQVYEAKKRSVQSHFQNLLRLEQRLLRMRQKAISIEKLLDLRPR